MADPSASPLPSVADAEVALARLQAMSAELRGAVILSPQGEPLAASGPAERWQRAATQMLDAADAAAGEAVSQVHVGSEDGETFAVRDRGYAVVAAAERFALASLLFFDIRTVLRDLINGPEATA